MGHGYPEGRDTVGMVVRMRVRDGTGFGFYPEQVYTTVQFSVRVPVSTKV